MDHRIAALNIERYHQTGHIDASYLANLSSDAVPILREFAEEYPELKDAMLERYAYVQTEKINHSWPAFNLARYRASRELTPLRTE
jgi:hypothetical protein